MSAVDTTWLRMDRPSNLMQIIGVLELEPPVDLDLLERVIGSRLLRFDRFRQRVEDRSGTPYWVDDPRLDVTRHVTRTRLPKPGGKNELQRFVAQQAASPLDPNRPLWQFHIVEDDEGGAAVVGRIHHAIADGMALVNVLMSITDGAFGASARTAPSSETGPWLMQGILRPISDGLQISADLWRKAALLAGSPGETLRAGTSIAAEFAYLGLMPEDSRTRFKGPLSGSKRVAWTDPIALPEVQAVSKALGCSINDMLLAAVAGALNGYLAEKGDRTEGVEIRALVPIDMRATEGSDELGNRFGIIAVELPVGFENPLARLYEVRRRMNALKASYEPVVTLGLLGALGYAPKLVQAQVFDLLLSRATAVMTNLPGPREPLFLAGSPVTQIIYWVPQAGEIGMGVSIMSYAGQVQFGLITDAALVPDPEAIVARFAPEFEQLLYFVLLEPWEARSSETELLAAYTRRAGTVRPEQVVRRVSRSGRKPKTR